MCVLISFLTFRRRVLIIAIVIVIVYSSSAWPSDFGNDFSGLIWELISRAAVPVRGEWRLLGLPRAGIVVGGFSATLQYDFQRRLLLLFQ